MLESGVPKDLAERVSVLSPAYAAPGIVETAVTTGTDLLEVARVHFTLAEELELGPLLERITALPRADRWQTMARAALRDELAALHVQLTCQVILGTTEGADAAARVQRWASGAGSVVERARGTLHELVTGETFDLARLSVALRVVRGLIRSEG